MRSSASAARTRSAHERARRRAAIAFTTSWLAADVTDETASRCTSSCLSSWMASMTAFCASSSTLLARNWIARSRTSEPVKLASETKAGTTAWAIDSAAVLRLFAQIGIDGLDSVGEG